MLFASACGSSSAQPRPDGRLVATTPAAATTETSDAGTETAEPAPLPEASAAERDHLIAQMEARRQQFAAGMEPATPIQVGTLRTSQRQDFQAVLSAGRCYKIIGVGGTEVTDLDLVLFDPEGVQLQQDIATDNYPVLGLAEPLCPRATGAYRVQVSMYAGSGAFAVQVFSAEP